jgi:hypothetical protein
VTQAKKNISAIIDAKYGGSPYSYNTMSGNFSSSSAEITWRGKFKGHFLGTVREEARYSYARSRGEYVVTFRGKVDEAKSHKMNVDGANVTWTEDEERTRATDDTGNSCNIPPGGSGSSTSVGNALVSDSPVWFSPLIAALGVFFLAFHI